MKNLNLNIKILVLIVTLNSLHSASLDSLKNSKVSKILTMSKSGNTFYGDGFKCSIIISEFDNRKVKKWIGGDSPNKNPRFVIDNITFSINGKEIKIPREEYLDLYDPQTNSNQLDVISTSRFIILKLNLSDGSGSATVYYIFEGQKYIKRLVKANKV